MADDAEHVAFDPTILPLLQREMNTWPPEQAEVASRIIRARLSDDVAELDALLNQQTGASRKLTVGQFLTVTAALKKISGEWTH
jgi:hypothetical protein